MSASKTIFDLDQAGNVVCSYVAADNGQETLKAEKTKISPVRELFYAFLPAGFPHSVTSDYLAYQTFDSLQAFASSITSLLASRAVLEGLGVGNESATATGALILKIIQDTFSRLATILFAHRMGTAIEPECKFYRFLADLLNDAAQFVDLLTPALPYFSKLTVMCAASILRSLCFVAASASKASLSAHFALTGNLAELNAKEASQETVVSLLGMMAGTLIVRIVHDKQTVWVLMMLLAGCHLATNYRAVRSVRMLSLNRQRATLVFRHYLDTGKMYTPAEVSRREHILRNCRGNLSSKSGDYTGTCDFFGFGDVRGWRPRGWLRYEFETDTYFLGIWHRGGRFVIRIALKEESVYSPTAEKKVEDKGEEEQVPKTMGERIPGLCNPALHAWFDAVSHAYHFDTALKDGLESHYENVMSRAGYISPEAKAAIFAGMMAAGWDLDLKALETKRPVRVRVGSGGDVKRVPFMDDKDMAHHSLLHHPGYSETKHD